ncbi:hypothetical protein K438DRAFT_1579322, partial [Mycena galopus ATCC 62051]
PRIIFAKRPNGADILPVPGEHLIFDASPSIDLEAVSLNGGFLTKTLMLTPEPFLRERMRDLSIQTTHAPFRVVGSVLVVVLRSEKEGTLSSCSLQFNQRDHMYGLSHWEAYTVQPYIEDFDTMALTPVPDPKGAYPWSRYLGVLGGPGLTAFCGLEAYGNAKKGETIYVSSGASGVGRYFPILNHIVSTYIGLKLIASAGSDAKVEYMRSLGADVAFNYRITPVMAALKEHGPLDIYWDNVGGVSVEAAIDNACSKARFIMCGSISEYNTEPHACYGVKNMSKIFKKRLQIHGLFVGDHMATLTPRFFSEVPTLVAQGKMLGREAITEGLETAGEALVKLLQEAGAKSWISLSSLSRGSDEVLV